MDKKQFIRLLAQRTGLTLPQARRALNACLDLIVTANSHRQRVAFSDFGTLQIQHMPAARHGDRPIFVPGDGFRQALS